MILAGMYLAAAISSANAETFSLVAYLGGSAAVPPNKSDAFGEADFTYDSDTRRLDYFVTYEGLALAQVEIHGPANVKENAPVLIPLPEPQSPISGAVILSRQEGNLLLAGELYVDAHSWGYAGGEIRGQIEKR